MIRDLLTRAIVIAALTAPVAAYATSYGDPSPNFPGVDQSSGSASQSAAGPGMAPNFGGAAPHACPQGMRSEYAPNARGYRCTMRR